MQQRWNAEPKKAKNMVFKPTRNFLAFFTFLGLTLFFSSFLFTQTAEAGDTKLGIELTNQHNVFGDLSISEALTVSKYAKIIVVDGDKYPLTSAGINSAISALPSAGGEVFLPEGTYSITASISITSDNITLRGAGRGTILDNSGIAADAIDVNTASGVVIKDLFIQAGNDDGISFTSVISGRIEGVWIDSAASNGMEIIGSDRNVIVSNNILGCTGYGIILSGGADSEDNVVANNVFRSNGTAIGTGVGSDGNQIFGNMLSGNTIGIDDSGDNVVVNNNDSGSLVIEPFANQDVELTLAGTNNLQINVGNLKIGEGTPTWNDGVDAFIGGNLEVFGDLSMGGDITIAGVIFSDDFTQVIGPLTSGGDFDLRGDMFDGLGEVVDIADGLSISEYLTVFGDLSSGGIFFVDNDTNRVGVGTASPTKLLHVHISDTGVTPSGDTDLYIEEGGASVGNTAVIELASSDTRWGGIYYSSPSSPGIGRVQYSHSNDLLYFTNNSNSFILDSAGNLGFGITTPTAKLDVLGNVSISGNISIGDVFRAGTVADIPRAFHVIDADTTVLASSFMDDQNDLYVAGDVEIGSRTSIAGDLTVGGTLYNAGECSISRH